jgi:hypothetical protein
MMCDVNMGFTEKKFNPGTHICLIFQDETERKTIMAKYVGQGLKDEEKVAYFADTMTKKDVLEWLVESGVDLGKNSSVENLTVQDTMSTYCPGGKFEVNTMLEKLKDFYRTSKEMGYDNGRITGEMSWALKGFPGSDRLMEYESWVNIVFKDYPITAICQYDANKFSGAMIMDALRVHPMMIVRGQIVYNPYYLSPDIFLEELKASR